MRSIPGDGKLEKKIKFSHFFSGSVYLTLCVSVERYVAVCLPLKARAICTFGRARCYVISLGVFAFLYNIPRFWEVTWHTVFYPDLKSNVTTVVPTPLRDNPTYISVYITWLYLVIYSYQGHGRSTVEAF